jgi:hypothetical protein
MTAARGASGVVRRVTALGASRLVPLGLGLATLVIGTLAGWDGGLITAIATPPALVRAALVGASSVAGLSLLGGAIRRMGASEPVAGAERDLVSLTRGVRLAFLAVAAFAMAGGWALAHPLPIVIGLVIAGVDVIETSFLLLVIATRRTGRVDG